MAYRPDEFVTAGFRDRFVVDLPDRAYLDGNSLGRLPKATADHIQQVVTQQWGNELIGSWNRHWLPLSRRIGDKIGQLIGAGPGQTIVCDSTSLNLYKLGFALLQQRGGRSTILTDSGNFPSDIYILEGLARQISKDLRLQLIDLSVAEHQEVSHRLSQAVNEDTALVCLSHVHFKSGYAFDLPAVSRLVRDRGARMLWDLSHSVGAMPIDMAASGADAAVGCTYKYLNGGPGAPAFLSVRSDLIGKLQNPIQGWFGAERPFDFSKEFTPNSSIDGFAVGTPPILSLSAVEPGVDLVIEAGIDGLRERSMALTEFFLNAFDQRLARLGYTLQTPRNPALRGSHISLGHPKGWQITQDLIHRFSVIPDFREPDTIRFGIAPLYTLASEIDRAVDALESSILNQSYLDFSDSRGGVT
jgi:kynureninase